MKYIQFGEGNFLRGFVDYILYYSNKNKASHNKVVVVKPVEFGNLDQFHAQNNEYTVILRGMQKGEIFVEKTKIDVIEKCIDPFCDLASYEKLMEDKTIRVIVSNTTEAGIVFDEKCRLQDEIPSAFPAKVTKLLYQRYLHFKGDVSKGFIFLPVELIDKNGDALKSCIEKYMDLWALEDDFKAWNNAANIYCNTLVDRIVSGYPKAEEEALWAELGYKDALICVAEPFGFWAIGSDKIEQVKKELAFDSNVDVIMTDDIEPYKKRKVRILNGAHTAMVMGAFLYGKDTVAECMEDEVIVQYLEGCLYDEIIPNIDLNPTELDDFAKAVIERFKNPFLHHKLLDISLNSTSKWKARVMPSFVDYYQSNGFIAQNLTLSFAMYVAFFKGLLKDETGYYKMRNNQRYDIIDDKAMLVFFHENKDKNNQELCHDLMTKTEIWDTDLTTFTGFKEQVISHLDAIDKAGMQYVLKEFINQ